MYNCSLKKKILIFTFFLSSLLAKGQCAMCRAQLESMDDNSLAESVNNGIVYLMAVPYVLIAVVGFFIYRSYQKKKQ